MSKLNKLYITIQIILITAIYFTIPNSLILQLVLWVNLFFTVCTLSFAELTDEELREDEEMLKTIQSDVIHEMMRLDAVVDELETLKKKSAAKKTTKKTTKK